MSSGSGRALAADELRQRASSKGMAAPAAALDSFVSLLFFHDRRSQVKAAVAGGGSSHKGIVLSLFNARGQCAELTMFKFQFIFWFGFVWNLV